MNKNLVATKQLDDKVLSTKTVDIPPQGWIRTIRKTLGMTIKQLASRLGLSSSRVVKMEVAEPQGAITLKTLQEVAESFDCKLVYSFVPKHSFEEFVSEKARSIALERLKRTAHTMALESQQVSDKWLEQQINDITEELLRENWKHLWNK